jgi:hypothetical protein
MKWEELTETDEYYLEYHGDKIHHCDAELELKSLPSFDYEEAIDAVLYREEGDRWFVICGDHTYTQTIRCCPFCGVRLST